MTDSTESAGPRPGGAEPGSTGPVGAEPGSTGPDSTGPDSSEQPHALIERRGHVLIVTMNRPHARNALSGPMMALMRQAWDQVDTDPDIRVAILTGAGGAFCAGADLKAMTSSHPGDSMGRPGVDLSVIESL